MIENPDSQGYQIKICWVTALEPEARPVIDLFDLRLLSNHLNFPVYLNSNSKHALVISGIGSSKAAAAVTYLKMLLDVQSYVGWINIGIAGFHLEPIGQIFQAIKVYDSATRRSYFPGFRLSKIVKCQTLHTVAQPETTYLENVLFDMEASGFCEIASIFSCNELVFVLKIVSDTPESPVSSVSKEAITQLIYQNKDKLTEIVRQIEKLVNNEQTRLQIPEEVYQYFDEYHFTQSNRYRFLKAYKKWKSAFPDRKLAQTLTTANSASELISKLESELFSAIKDWKL
tara:strand:+ start:2240 stop:3097 length:858 start_codon:yes stop_codon:yes gene_type:complete